MLDELTSDQEALRETTARFLDNLMPVDKIRRLRDDSAGFEPDYWRRGAELGWTSLMVSEARGGGTVSDFALQDLGLIAYEFGRHAAPGPLVPVNVVASALDSAGSAAQHKLLEPLIAGTTVAAWCFGEPPPNDKVGDIDLDIQVDGSSLVLNGVKRPVEHAGQAEYLLVTGRTGTGLTQVLLPADTPGVTVSPMTTLELTRRYAVVRFDNVRMPVDAAVGAIGEAAAQVDRQTLLAISLHNSESVGAMQRAFEMTKDWAFDRYSFGRPLASYQEIKHRFADLLSWLEAAHAMNDLSIAAYDTAAPDAGELVSAAKAFIGQYAAELGHDCVQLHGGIGVTFEHDLHLFLRRISVNRMLYGTPDEHLERVGTIVANRKEQS